MHPYKRAIRVGDTIKKETADIIMNKLRDPRIGFVTVTGARVSDDLRHATVYVSVFDEKKLNRTMDVLNSSASFVKAELSRRLKMRYIPDIHFILDESIEYGKKIDRILDEIGSEESGGYDEGS